MGDRMFGPTIETAGVVLAVFVVQMALFTFGAGMELFALSMPFASRPWTLITSIYAHGGVQHLIANIVALLLFGWIVERHSTRFRFHLFILLTGMISGIAEVLVGSMIGPSPLVVGISGAVFALMGYVVASNPVTVTILNRTDIDPKIQFGMMLLIALLITWVTRGERVALIAHFTGFMLGLMAGRLRLLRTSNQAQHSRAI